MLIISMVITFLFVVALMENRLLMEHSMCGYQLLISPEVMAKSNKFSYQSSVTIHWNKRDLFNKWIFHALYKIQLTIYLN